MKPVKAFSCTLENGIVLILDNGWLIDASFGKGSYSDNHNVEWDYSHPPTEIESDTCETVVEDNLGEDHTLEIAKNLGLRSDGDKRCAVMPYLDMKDWLRVLAYVMKQERRIQKE
jgi:hypothetical protein